MGLVLDVSDAVDQYVHDKHTANQIIDINKEMLATEAAFGKEMTEARDELARLNKNRIASKEAFERIFATVDEQRAKARETFLDSRFKMLGLMTASEWNNVYSETGRD